MNPLLPAGIVLGIGFLYLGYLVFVYSKAKVPYVLTKRKQLESIMNLLPITEDSVMYDLGSASGEVLFYAEKYAPKKLIGYELSPLHVSIARIRAYLRGSRAKFYLRDFMEVDISDADILYLFLTQQVVPRVWDKIQRECSKGTIVAILSDTIPGKDPIQKIAADPDDPKSRFYRIYLV